MAVKTPLTREEKADVRRYLGYLDTAMAANISLGIPSASQPMFIAEGQMERLNADALAHVREYLQELRCIDKQIKEARSRRLKLSKVKGIEFRADLEIRDLYQEYGRWTMRLSDTLGAPINPYSELHQEIGTVPTMARRVR